MTDARVEALAAVIRDAFHGKEMLDGLDLYQSEASDIARAVLAAGYAPPPKEGEIAGLRARLRTLADEVSNAGELNYMLDHDDAAMLRQAASALSSLSAEKAQLTKERDHARQAAALQTEQHEYPCSPHCAGYLRELALSAQLAAAQGALTGVPAEIAAERARQISAEGWTPEHDDEHATGELALAASVYAGEASGNERAGWTSQRGWNIWPWWPKDFKAGPPRRMLVKAGALIVAEIERLDRAALRAEGPNE